MRLNLPIPADWQTEERDGTVFAHVPGPESTPDLTVTMSALRAIPPVVDSAWIHAQLATDLPDGATLQIQQSADDKSAQGWPVTRFRTAVMSAAGQLLEQRISVFFRVLDQYAIADLRGTNRDRWNELSNELGITVMGAELDWSGPPCCLAQLYGFGPNHPVFGGTDAPTPSDELPQA